MIHVDGRGRAADGTVGHFPVRQWGTTALALLAIACDGQGFSEEPTTLMWDTAAVPHRIASARAAAEAPRWRLAPRPLLEIGAAVGDTTVTFGRVHDALRLRNGRIVVADRQASQLRIFDHGGELLAAAGRAGDGPGEFRDPRRVLECARDSVFVYDPAHDRVSVFSAAGTFSRSFHVELPRPPPLYRLGCSRERLLVAEAWPPLTHEPEGPFETEAPISLADASGNMISVLGDFPGQERVGNPRGSNPRVFGQETFVGASAAGVYVGVSSRYEIGVFSTEGEIEAVFGIDLPARPVTDADVEQYAEQETAREGLSADRAREIAGDLREQVPEHFPFFDRLLVASTGDVWVRRYAKPTDESHRWDVFSGTGAYRGSLEVPGAFEPLDVDDDRVTGRWRGRLDEAYVRVYRLISPEHPRR